MSADADTPELPEPREPAGTSEDLRTFILAQSRQGIAVPVLLFDSDGSEETVESVLSDASSPTDHDPAALTLAGRLGLDLDALALFSTEAYVLQSGLGQQIIEDLNSTAGEPGTSR